MKGRLVQESARWLLLLLLPVILGKVGAEGDDGVTITYIANEGVLIAHEDSQVLIDGLHRPYRPAYAVLPTEERQHIETAQPPYDEIDVILVSHVHRDHFHADAVGRHLRHNANAILIASGQVADSVKAYYEEYDAVREQVRTVTPAIGERISMTVKGIEVEVLGLRHGSERFRWVQNLGHIVSIGGKRILHIGDADMTAGNFEAFSLAEANIDIAFIPYWFLESRAGRSIVREVIQPKHVISVHIPPADARTAIQTMASFDTEGVAFTRMLEVSVYED